jgi:aspartate ammonia-lyase
MSRLILRLLETLHQQQQSFQSLTKKLGQALPDEIESILANRDRVEPEAELSVDMVTHLQEKFISFQKSEFDRAILSGFESGD